MQPTQTTRVDASQANPSNRPGTTPAITNNRPNGNQAIDAVVRFLRSFGLDRAEWGTDLICYHGGRKLTSAIVEQEGHYDMKRYWYELEIFLTQEIGMFDPERPRRFSKDRPQR